MDYDSTLSAKLRHARRAGTIALLLFIANAASAQTTVDLLGTVEFPGKRITDVTSYVDVFTLTEYAVVGHSGGGTSGISIVDLSDPESPQIVGNLDGPPGFDVKVFDTYAYTVTGGGDNGTNQGAIIDISNPFAPVRVAGFPSSHNIFIDDSGFMYASISGLSIYDLNSNPLQPELVWHDERGSGHDATAVGNMLFDFHGSSGTYIYDTSNKEQPIEIGHITAPFVTYHHSGWPTADGQFLFVNDELSQDPSPDVTIWDISDPSDPTFVTSISDATATVHNLHIIGDLAFFSYYSAGFRVYDISDPTNPQLVGEFDTDPVSEPGFSGAFGVDAFLPSGLVLISGTSTPDPGKLHVFSVTGFTTVGLDDGGVSGLELFDIEVYPNPASGNVTFSFKQADASRVSVYNLAGQEIWTQSLSKNQLLYELSLDVSSFPTGVYYARVEAGVRSETQSFTIVR